MIWCPSDLEVILFPYHSSYPISGSFVKRINASLVRPQIQIIVTNTVDINETNLIVY